MEDNKIKIGIPKGSLQNHTLKIFDLAGLNIIVRPRNYVLSICDPEIEAFLLRPQEIPKYVESGKIDLGISGQDWITEKGARVIEICDLRYAKKEIKKIKWVLAVSEKSGIKSVKDLDGKLVSTEIVNVAKKYFKEKGVKAKVEFSWGATEVKPPLFSDAVVDLTETGESLRAHNLKVLDTVFESSTKLIANKKSIKDSWKKEKIEDLALLLKGAVESEEMTTVSMHVEKKNLERILKILPSFKKPTVTKITSTSWYDVMFVVHEKDVLDLIPELKKLGGTGIIEYELNKVIP